MAVISITTTQNIEIGYDLASVGERIVACIIDLVIFVAWFIITSLIFSYADFSWLNVFINLPIAFYSLLSETFLNGQSVGKKVMGIKVISLNGSQASFSQYLIRWLFRLVDIWIGSGVIAVIMVAATEKHQRIGDLIAGTTLVKTKARSNIEQTLYVPVAETSYNVTYPEVINLRDSDMQLIKEVILNVRKSGNPMLAWQTVEKLESVLHIKNQYGDPMNFLYVLLSDYNHLAAQER
ncbi:RDD family protein [Panacibacter ginsenosidivorans]|uniref:RDD family protein n=1 Tax=Panacibacter ginsenosidivorans TaxID=1813871 RepID=A0A5B8V6H5_9BACT|nr:RDD family protein [Panacibacter ginsenosidivorans]QEC66246.1 RDD family protein [Panacibacter ginsenosidivorans]